MKGETRKVVQLNSGRGDALTRSTPPGPTETTFFLSDRVKLSDKVLSNPYRQHAYFHAAVKRKTAALSSAPFRIFQETTSTARRASGFRRAAWGQLTRKHPKLRKEIFDIFQSKGDKVRRRLMRDFARTIQILAPDASLDLICKAVGIEPVEQGAFYDLFRDVNPQDTRSQLWEATTIYMDTDGESFWILLKGGKKWEPPPAPVPPGKWSEYIPDEIWPYGKKGWSPERNDKTKLLKGWKYDDKQVVKEPLIFKTEQIIHHKYYDPDDPVRGLAPADALRLELEQDHNAARYQNAFFKRGAQLPWVMVFKNGIQPNQRRTIEEQLVKDYTGLDNMHAPGVFEGDADIKNLGMSQRDMEYYTLRQWVRDEVLAVVGTPKSEMGIFQDVNRASSQVSKRVFWENTILPLLHYYEDNLDSELFAPITDGQIFGMFDLSMVEALREDLSDKAKVAETLWKLGFTADEINERLDLGFESGLPWREKWWVNQNLKPVGEDGNIEEPAGDGDSDGDGGGDGGPGDSPGGDDGDGGDGGVEPGDGDGGDDGTDSGGDSSDGDSSAEGVLVGRAFDPTDAEAVLLVTTQAERVQRIVDTVRGTMIATLQQGIEQGLTHDQLMDSVREKFNFITGAANEGSKAATESAQMTNIARTKRMRDKHVALNMWINAMDERVRADHVTLGGEEHPVGFNFGSLVGATGILEFPLDPRAEAGQVVNCRCALIPTREGSGRSMWTPEQRDAHWLTIFERVMEPGEKALRKAIHKIFWRIRGAQLALIAETPTPEAHTGSALAFKPDTFKADLTKAVEPIYAEIYGAAVEQMDEELAELGLLEEEPA
jgi:HK97 family phage portal protein